MDHVRTDVILAKDLARLVNWWAPLVNEIVNALLPGYQLFPLLPTSRKGRRADAARNSISAEDLVTLS